MTIKDMLVPMDDKWASIVGKLPVTYHDSEEEAGKATDERLKLLGAPETVCKVVQLACFRLDVPEMLVLIDPEDKNSELQLGRTILQQLGSFASKVSTVMKGKPVPVVKKAKTQGAAPPAKQSGMEWGK